MNTFAIESWCKPQGAEKSMPMGVMRFRVDEKYHLQLENEEERLAGSDDQHQSDIDVDMDSLELQTPESCGELSDCHFHVYVRGADRRGQFFLVGHRASDGALVYSNAVLVDELG